MDFKPSPERQILFDTLKKYFENEYSLSDRNIAAHSDLGYSKKAWEAMRDLGILESLIDPELDGFGGTALDISTVFEALGKRSRRRAFSRGRDTGCQSTIKRK